MRDALETLSVQEARQLGAALLSLANEFCGAS